MSGPEYGEVHDSYCPVCGKRLGVGAYRLNDEVYCSKRCATVATLPKGVFQPPDPVISPPHYTAGGIETIDFIKAKLTPDEFRGYLKGSVIKYLSRANLKGNEDQDYRKASFYGQMLAGEDPRKEAE